VLYRNSPLSKVERNITLIDSLNSFIGFKKIYLKSAYRKPLLTDPQEEARYQIKWYAARSFVYRGHSLSHFRRELAVQCQSTNL
jgi:hypothetical protein